MMDRNRAITIVTAIHQIFVQCQREATHTRPQKSLSLFWQRRSMPTNLARIERNYEHGSRVYIDALVIDNRLADDMRAQITSRVLATVEAYAPVQYGHARISADYLEIFFDMLVREDETIYGFYVLKRARL